MDQFWISLIADVIPKVDIDEDLVSVVQVPDAGSLFLGDAANAMFYEGEH
jgi:hypothetical protein